MSDNSIYLIGVAAFFLLELAYFSIASRYNIVDKPNQRSSHSSLTIRGGGVIVVLSCFFWYFSEGFPQPFFMAGLTIIGLVSFIDDVRSLKSGIRSLVHLLAVGLLLYQLGAEINVVMFLLLLALIVGTINAYNFMDGINGITGGYSIVTISALWFVNRFFVAFTSESLLIFVLLALIVFGFFNFRAKARCFAGDVGSVSIAFIICFLIGQLIVKIQNPAPLLFLLIYGLDAGTTIAFRICRGENITQAHRSHFYQYLANEKKWPHLLVSVIYCIIQAFINVWVIYYLQIQQTFTLNLGYLFSLIGVSCLLFVLVRLKIEGRVRLFGA